LQVEPQAQSVVVTTPSGSGLSLDPGRQVVARVIDADGAGSAKISLAGQTLTVNTTLDVRAGDTLSLTVSSSDSSGVRFTLNQSPSAPAALPQNAEGVALPGVSRQLAEFAPAAIRELARAGVPVTPQLAQAASSAIESLVAGGTAPTADGAARAVANLVSRDLALSPQAAGRVIAALDAAGRLGAQLQQLASQSPTVAQALPSAPPDAQALRSLLAPSLTPAELAVARIAQASEAARAAHAAQGTTTAPPAPTTTGSTVVATNAAVSNNATIATADAAARANLARTPVSTQPAPAAPAPAAPQTSAPAPQAATRQPAPTPAQTAQTAQAAVNAVAQRAQGAVQAAVTPAVAAAPTPQPVAQVIATMSVVIARHVPAHAAATGAAADAAAMQGRAVAATTGQAPGGAFVPESTGSSSSGAPAPLVAGLRASLLGSDAGAQQRGGGDQLLSMMSQYNQQQIAAALRQLPEPQTLQLAGRLLELMPAQMAELPAAQREGLRQAMHGLLDDLGRALSPVTHDDQALLRAALEQVATNDPRGGVADQAKSLLHAMDGQQVLSNPRSGADPGYVYFQLPMPNGQSAEVVVRREAGRRQVTFDTFNIAFLLSTESMGPLMIQLDAHPAAVRATVRTERPELETFIAQQAELLREPVEREARRPLVISTGVFGEGGAPTSLLEPSMGAQPGEGAWYA
jgi:hypothetical protein